MLEANNLEDDVKVLYYETGVPNTVNNVIKNIDKKSRLIKCAATVDLVEIASEENVF